MEDQITNQQHHQHDVNPGKQLDQLLKETDQDNLPDLNGTGANRPVQTAGTVIIESDTEEEGTDNEEEEDSEEN